MAPTDSRSPSPAVAPRNANGAQAPAAGAAEQWRLFPESAASDAARREQSARKSQERTLNRLNRRTVNSIWPTRANERAAAPNEPAPGSRGAATKASEPSPAKPAEAPAAATSANTSTDADPPPIPQSVRDRFIADGRRWYFPDGVPAFKDLGQRLTTRSENTEIVHSLLEIAKARGWTEIAVGGTQRFRQEAWLQARLAGIEVRGYKPKAVEQAQLVRAFARRSETPEVGLRRESDPEEARSEELRPVPPSGARGSSPLPGATESGGVSREKIVGKLWDHGRDTYRHDPHEELSYFVTIHTSDGHREFWGRDLERAITKSLSQPQIGDDIVLQRTSREPVTVKRHQRDSRGGIVSTEDVSTYRIHWSIERSDFMEERAAAASTLRDPSIERKRAVRQHPELEGMYRNLEVAKIAARAIRDPADQRRFVAMVRGALADQVQRGEPLQAVRSRERARTPPSRGGREPRELTPGRT